MTLPRDGDWRVLSYDSRVFRAGKRMQAHHTVGVTIVRQYPRSASFHAPRDFLSFLDGSLRTLQHREVRLLQFNTALAPGLGPYCVRFFKRSRAVDRERPIGEDLIHQIEGYGCRHPMDASVFVDISYSELGPQSRMPVSEVSARADRVLGRVRLVDLTRHSYQPEDGIVGLELAGPPAREGIEVVTSYSRFDAYRQGIRDGDRILLVDGADIQGRALADVVRLLRGTAGTTTRVLVLRKDTGEKVALDLMRLPARAEPSW